MAKSEHPDFRNQPIEIFISYSHKDEGLRKQLEKHLSILKRQGLIDSWSDRKIGAGEEWRGKIDEHLDRAQIVLLLVSSDFLASDYCYDIEVQKALQMHDSGQACVVPIILRPVDWQGAPFSKLNALPTDAKPITNWRNRDKAFEDVAKGIRKTVEEVSRTIATQFSKPESKPNKYFETPKRKWVLVLNATFDEIDKEKAELIISTLAKIAGNAELTLKSIEPGSVLMVFESSEESFERLSSKIETGQLAKVHGFKILEQISFPSLTELGVKLRALKGKSFGKYTKILRELGYYFRLSLPQELDDNYVLAVEPLLEDLLESTGAYALPSRTRGNIQEAQQKVKELARMVSHAPNAPRSPWFIKTVYELGILLSALSTGAVAAEPSEFFSCFISHSAKDKHFCERLYSDLQAKGVRVWYFPEDAKWGEPVWGEIDRSIKVYDKLIVVCSENSLQSGPVNREIERALNREAEERKAFLFPIRIDDYVFNRWQHERKADVLRKVVGDFSGWDMDAAKYEKAFDKLLKGLQAESGKV